MLKVTKNIKNQIIENQTRIYGGAIDKNWSIVQQVEENYSAEVAERDFQEIIRWVKIDKKMKILDLGCGYGFFAALLRKKGYLSFGCDVDKSSVKVAKELLKENNIDTECINPNSGQKLPYPDEYFDFINLNYVLVYVKNIENLFREIKRVLKNEGEVYLITPNYQCCYDVNYGIFLIPWLPKKINKLYLKILGKENLSFFDTFNFTTKRKLEKIFRKNDLKFENIGLKKWLEFLQSNSFVGRSELLKRIVNFSRRYKVGFVFGALGKIGFYTPLVYVLRK